MRQRLRRRGVLDLSRFTKYRINSFSSHFASSIDVRLMADDHTHALSGHRVVVPVVVSDIRFSTGVAEQSDLLFGPNSLCGMMDGQRIRRSLYLLTPHPCGHALHERTLGERSIIFPVCLGFTMVPRQLPFCSFQFTCRFSLKPKDSTRCHTNEVIQHTCSQAPRTTPLAVHYGLRPRC